MKPELQGLCLHRVATIFSAAAWKILAVIFAASLLTAQSAQAQDEIVAIEIKASENACPSSFSGRWPEAGDNVDVIEIKSDEISSLYKGAKIMAIPPVSEIAGKKPCTYTIRIQVNETDAGELNKAIAEKRQITIMRGSPP